jgi:hypothetical protein
MTTISAILGIAILCVRLYKEIQGLRLMEIDRKKKEVELEILQMTKVRLAKAAA